MSDEEKKAIKYIKNILNYEKLYYHDGIETNFLRPVDKENVKTVLNLIEKQSKEIEESKQKEKEAYIDGTNIADKLCNKKWEDKIKAKTIEIKNRQVKDEFITASQGKLNTIIDMESLLEKE